jgi:hypothetical protein
MQAIILDKSYLEGASRAAIQELMERRTVLMCGALFYELLDTTAKQRTRCFAKLPAVENPLVLVDHVGELMRKEVETRRPSGLPSQHAIAIRFRFNPALLSETYELPPEAREAMQEEVQDLSSEAQRLVDLSESSPSMFPDLLKGNGETRVKAGVDAEASIANPESLLPFYKQLSSPDPSRPFPPVTGPEWAHFRWLQVQMLFSIDLHVRYQGRLRANLTKNVLVKLEHDVHDAQALALGVLEGALATREEKLARWFKLLKPNGELVR